MRAAFLFLIASTRTHLTHPLSSSQMHKIGYPTPVCVPLQEGPHPHADPDPLLHVDVAHLSFLAVSPHADGLNAGGLVWVHGVPYCVLECGIIVR